MVIQAVNTISAAAALDCIVLNKCTQNAERIRLFTDLRFGIVVASLVTSTKSLYIDRFANGPADATVTHSVLQSCSSKSRLVLRFWYRLTLVVPDKGPLNGCCCCCTLHLVWLVVGWVTVFVLVCNQPTRSTQTCIPKSSTSLCWLR